MSEKKGKTSPADGVPVKIPATGKNRCLDETEALELILGIVTGCKTQPSFHEKKAPGIVQAGENHI